MTARLAHATESRFHRDSEGAIRSPHPVDAYEQSVTFLSVFDEVRIAARIDETTPSDSGHMVEGPRVRVIELPDYRGATGAVRSIIRLRSRLRDGLEGVTHASARLPGVIGSVLLMECERRDIPFLAHVVGDPYDVMRSGVAGRLGTAAAPVVRGVMRRQVRRASAAAYVSQQFLQGRYPSRPNALQIARPGANFAAEDFRGREDFSLGDQFRLVAVGSQEQMYKGHDTILRAAAELRASGIPVTVVLVGDGRYRAHLESLAASLGVDDVAVFTSTVRRHEMNRMLDDADLFLMPSLTEGVPRALMEAMARSLPAVGSDAGGIPELLEADAIIPRGDVASLAQAIQHAYHSEPWRRTHGQANFARIEALLRLSTDELWRSFLTNFRNGERAESAR